MKIVPATPELVREYYGEDPPVSMRAHFLLNDDDHPIGVAGFVRYTPGVKMVFTEGKEEAYADKKTLLRFARFMLGIADANNWTLIAQADDTKTTAHGFLTHLGFELDEEGVYTRWPDSQQQSLI